jgi:hypothetical protein
MKSLGRRAGLLFFLHGLPAPFALLYVARRIFVPGDMAATADRVREHAMLLRLSIVAEIWQCLFLVFAAIAIYRLLREVDHYLAVVTTALIWISLPIQMVNLLNHTAPLALTSGTTFLTGFTSEQVDGLTYLFVRLHAQGLQIAQVFWGLWLIPWGLAAVRSGFMPRWIGAAIIVAGVAYMLNSGVAILAPHLAPVLSPWLLSFGVAEIAKTGYLLLWGAREPHPSAIRAVF